MQQTPDLLPEQIQGMLAMPPQQEQLAPPVAQEPAGLMLSGSGATPLAGAMTPAQLQRAASVHPVPDRVPAALLGGIRSNYYVTYRDVKEPAQQHTPAHSHGGAGSSGGRLKGHYQVKFFLVDNEGVEHLAAVGEDLGDAHYSYTNETGFPFLRARNRLEVEAWLQQQIRDSEHRAGLRPEMVLDAALPDPMHYCLPKFVGKDHEKTQQLDGGHIIRWFLIDERGKRHLAVVGRETHTHDGHYDYATFGLFEQLYPLRSHNQRAVEGWCESMCVHGGVAPPLLACKATSTGTAGASAVAGSAAGRIGGAGTAGRPPLGRSGKKAAGTNAAAAPAAAKHDLLRTATANAKKLRVVGSGNATGHRSNPHQDARDVAAAELRRWAVEEAARREAVKNAALAYLADAPSQEDAADTASLLRLLKQAAAQPGFVGGGGRAPSHQQQVHLLEVIQALQRLSHGYSSLHLLATPELKETLASLAKHRHSEVAALAAAVLKQWLTVMVMQAQVLGEPRYTQDPRSVVEAAIEDPARFDPLATAITRRPVGQTIAAGGAGGTETPLPSGLRAASSTPGGPLSTMPSELSLASMDTQGAATMEAPSSGATNGGSGGDPLQPQTVERRRLHLDTSPGATPTVGGGGMGLAPGSLLPPSGSLAHMPSSRPSDAQLLDVPAAMDTETAEFVPEALL